MARSASSTGFSVKWIMDCGLTFLHVFPFSARPGTPAARMPQVHGSVVAKRAAQLRDKGALALKRHLDGAEGQRIEVLMENEGLGRAQDFTPVRLAANQAAGALVKAVVSGHDGAALTALVRP